MKEKCQIEGCQYPAKSPMYKLEPDGVKVWCHVCDKHEGEIGNSNMRLQGYNPRTGRKLSDGN